MTTPPIDRIRSAYVPPALTDAESSTPAEKSSGMGGPTAADLQEIGAVSSWRQAAGDLSAPNVSPLTAAKASGALDELSAYGGNLSDLLASMATTMAEIFQKLRKSAVEGKVAELKSQVQAMQGQAEKMRDAADKNYSAALTQGWTQFAGGAVGLAGGAVAAHASFKAGKEIHVEQAPKAASPNAMGAASSAPDAAEADGFDDLLKQAGSGRSRANAFKGGRPADPPQDRTSAATTAEPPVPSRVGGQVDLLNSRSRLATELSSSMGSVITGLGGVFSAGQKHAADMDDAQGKELEAQSTKAAAAMAREDELAQTWKEAMQRLMDNLKAAIDQEQAASKATIQNI
jgi:hypothetical protein